jgi:hypothetical protein
MKISSLFFKLNKRHPIKLENKADFKMMKTRNWWLVVQVQMMMMTLLILVGMTFSLTTAVKDHQRNHYILRSKPSFQRLLARELQQDIDFCFEETDKLSECEDNEIGLCWRCAIQTCIGISLLKLRIVTKG